MAEFTVPSDTASAVKALATAQGWERAAIVYTFTDLPRSARIGGYRVPFADFARLGVEGLADADTVRGYYMCWHHAVMQAKPTKLSDAMRRIRPGDTITLPELPWPPAEYPSPDLHPLVAKVIERLESVTGDLRGLVEVYALHGIPREYLDAIDNATAGVQEAYEELWHNVRRTGE
jgi:hypothetical protein